MEKTIHISINATSFQLTESAYQKLKAYLESLKAHFAHEEDNAEIIRDIESRIAEKMLEKRKDIIHEQDIEGIIADIGHASEFEAESVEGRPSASSKTSERKLYRNTEDVVLMGVASGIAAYFDTDPLYIRLAFVASTFFGGLGVAIYIILSFIIPPAQTASQKLEMRGDAVTLDTITRTIKERAEEVNKEIKKQGKLSKILLFPFRLLGALIKMIHQNILPIIGKIIGSLIVIISFLAVLGLTGLLTTIAANWNSIDAPIRTIVDHKFLWTDIGAIYIALLIPLLLILSLGQKLINRHKETFSNAVGFGLMGVWCLAIIIGAATTTRIGIEYSAFIKANPEYQHSNPFFEERISYEYDKEVWDISTPTSENIDIPFSEE